MHSKRLRLPVVRELTYRFYRIFAMVSLSLSLSDSFGQRDTSVTLDMNNKGLQEIFREIESLTDYTFVYDDSAVRHVAPRSIHVRHQGIHAVMEKLLKGSGNTFRVIKTSVVIVPVNVATPAGPPDTRLIRVMDTEGNPVSPALLMKDGHILAVTDRDGSLRVPVPGSDTRRWKIQSMGFEDYTFPLVGMPEGKDWTVILKVKTDSLTGVEVAFNGYQAIPRERATGSFEIIGKELFNRQTSADVLGRLEAVGNSISVDRSSGVGGIMVRGLSTIQGPKSPLVVVDDFPYDGDINNINPNDVENVTILKDAAASSIWGAQAANGVIVITTKKGRFGQPLKVEASGNVQVSGRPDLHYIPQMSSRDFIDAERFLYGQGFYNSTIGSGSHPVITPAVELMDRQAKGEIDVATLESGLADLARTDIRDQFKKYMYSTAVNQQYAVSMRGGSRSVSWSGSVGLDRQSGSLHEFYQRISIRTEAGIKPFPWLQLTNGISYTGNENKSGRSGYGSILSNSSDIYPYARFADEEGNALNVYKDYNQQYKDTVGGGGLLDWNYYPLEEYKHSTSLTERRDIVLRTAWKASPIKGLELTGQYQYERQSIDIRSANDIESYVTRNLVNSYAQRVSGNSFSFPIPKGGITDISNAVIAAHNLRGMASYRYSGDKHSLDILAGGELRRSRQASYRTRYYGEDPNTGTTVNVDYTHTYPGLVNGSADYIPDMNGSGDTRTNYVSAFANASYAYLGRYTVSGSARRDASNLFGLNTNDQWNPFWSAGLAWDVSREPWWKSVAVPYLRIRATYGFSGNIDPSMVASTTIYYAGTNSYTGTPYARFDNIYNPDLRWETSRMTNVGLDFRTRDNLFAGSVEYYHKRGYNLFGNDPVDYTAGTNYYIVRNVADMKSNGIDIKITSHNLRSGRLKWQTLWNFSYNKETVTKYYQSAADGYNYVYKDGKGLIGLEGKNVYSVMAYKWGGLNPENGNPVGYLDGETSEDYASITGSGTKVDDLIYFGSGLPTVFGNIVNTLSYGHFSLDIGLLYKLGYYLHRRSISYSGLANRWIGHSDYSRRWQAPGDELKTDVPSFTYPVTASKDNFYAGSEALVIKGDHVRLKFVNLSYDLQAKTPNQRNVRIYCNIANLGLLWKANHEGIDPDYNTGNYPLVNPAAVAFGVNVQL